MTFDVMAETLTAEYFDRLYRAADDPWSFATSAYELEKYERTIEYLGGPYREGLEIGCSVGVLTEMLASRFERLLALDINERALQTAVARCANHPNVRFERAAVPAEFPRGTFDAIVLSEVGYYWSRSDLDGALERIVGAAPGGVVALIHFLPKVADYPTDGDTVHERFAGDPRLTFLRGMRAERYRIDVFAVAGSRP